VTAHVDDVFADVPVRIVDEGVRFCLGAGVVGDARGASIEGAVGSHVVVVTHDLFENELQLAECRRRSFGEEALERAMPTLDLPAGLWMVGTRVFVEDARGDEVALEAGATAARRARAFFEATVADNLDIGRPDEIKLIFNRRIRSDTTGEFATRVARGTEVTVNAFYKHSRIKQYLKEGRALRIETVVNNPSDVGVQRRLTHLAELVDKAKSANRRLLELERIGQGCAIETALWERISQPSRVEGQRTGAIRFGDSRAMALAGALCVALNTVVGFTNQSLRALVSQLLDQPFSSSQMTYDLRRLRLKGLVTRIEHTNRYSLSDDELRFAVTYTKLGRRLLPPLLSVSQPLAPRELHRAYSTIEHHVDDYLVKAGLSPAA
jgi:hypothetical protein